MWVNGLDVRLAALELTTRQAGLSSQQVAGLSNKAALRLSMR